MAKSTVREAMFTNERQRRAIPPDPEDMNDERAEWAGAAIEEFIRQTNADEEDAVCDLIGDLAHWCDRNGYQFSELIKRAMNHYGEETMNRKGDSKGLQFRGISFMEKK